MESWDRERTLSDDNVWIWFTVTNVPDWCKILTLRETVEKYMRPLCTTVSFFYKPKSVLKLVYLKIFFTTNPGSREEKAHGIAS